MMRMKDFSESPAVAFGRDQLEKACEKARSAVDYTLTWDPDLPEQCYELRQEGKTFYLRAGDEAGAMYALLDLTDSLEVHQGVPVLEEG